MRSTASAAAKKALQADIQASDRLDACLVEERQQASADRTNLLSQITALVNQVGKDQDARLEIKINAVRDDVSASRTDLEQADKAYNEGMDQWSTKEQILVEEVLRSRENLKAKLKKDWTVCASYLLPKHTDTDHSC